MCLFTWTIKGKVPLVIAVESADAIASLIRLKGEVEEVENAEAEELEAGGAP